MQTIDAAAAAGSSYFPIEMRTGETAAQRKNANLLRRLNKWLLKFSKSSPRDWTGDNCMSD